MRLEMIIEADIIMWDLNSIFIILCNFASDWPPDRLRLLATSDYPFWAIHHDKTCINAFARLMKLTNSHVSFKALQNPGGEMDFVISKLVVRNLKIDLGSKA